MSDYIGLTIGPIIEVLQNAKKTRELWTGSYLFSFLMKIMVKYLMAKGDAYTFLSPVVDEQCFEEKHGVGLFHDRFIAMSDLPRKTIEADVDKAIVKAKENLAQIIVKIEPEKPEQIGKVRQFLDQFLQISYIITSLPEGSNIFTEINNFLDNAELQRSFISDPSHYEIFSVTKDDKTLRVNPIAYLQARTNQSCLIKDAFASHKRFPCVAEIAGKELVEQKKMKIRFNDDNDDDDDDDFYPKECEKKYKYMALIQADGDNVGELVKKVGKEPRKARAFSKKLFDFALEVPRIGKKYGAQVVYAGGDDVLAFAPLVYHGHTVFEFLDELDEAFKDKFSEDAEARVSLSFGVSAVYHKFPLYEALGLVSDNLFRDAKDFKYQGENPKNAIVFELIKNSGQTMKTTFLRNETGLDVYNPFKTLLKSELEGSTTIPHGLQHNLKRYETVIGEIAKKEDFHARLKYFFQNNFNEPVHEKGKVKSGLDLARELLAGFFDFYKEEKKSQKEVFKEFFNALSIIKHLRGEEKTSATPEEET